MNSEVEALKRILERERKARKASEKILEEKSLELYQTNQELQKLNDSLENRYSLIVEQANDIIYRGDENGFCTFVNSVAERILGYKQEELLGKHFTELVTEDCIQDVVEFYQKQRTELKENTYYEFTVGTKNGERKWLGQNVSLIIEDEKIIGTSAVARDITKQKQAEEEVKRNEAKYRSIIENMELGLLEVDTKGLAVSANSRFKEMTGYSEADLIGKDPAMLLMDKVSKELIDSKHSERKEGESSVYEVKGKKKNGETFWLLISGAPRFDKEGNFIGSIGIHMDITQRKRLLNQLEAAKSLAEESSKAKETFLAHMSHEIRTPLNSVLGMTHLLQDTNPTEEQKDYLETIKYSSEILLNIISDILDISKIEAGEAEFNETTFDLHELLIAQQKTFAFRLADKKVEVVLDWDKDIKTKLIGDKMFINQILMNLLGNASKFTQEGEIKLSAKKGKELDQHQFIEFTVSDTGIGIKDDNLNHIFDSFKQADSSTEENYGGTGLGLSIAKNLVELHGGEITVKSAIGKGTTFHISIPFKKSDEPLAAVQNTRKEKASSGSVLKDLTVLVAEDNQMNQKFISKVLERFEVDYQLCENGQLAIEFCEEKQYDLILMDIQMPIKNGYMATKTIRESGKNQTTPIIALTASALVDEKKKALASGMNEHLSKPFSPEQLKVAMEQFVVKSDDQENVYLDQEYLKDFYGEDPKFKTEMFKIFLKNVEKEMTALNKAVVEGNHEMIYQIAHKNCSSFTMVGLGEIEKILRKIEEQGRTEDKDAKGSMKQLNNLLPKAIDAVESELDELKK